MKRVRPVPLCDRQTAVNMGFMKSRTPILLALFLPALALGDPAEYRIDFERPALSQGFSKSDWAAYGLADVGFVQAPQRAFLDESIAHSGEQSLRIFFPKASVGPSEGGNQASLRLDPAPQYCLSYWLKFSENFSWGGAEQGGKLPGLAQGELCSGGDRCNGTNGFTARYMWRTDGAAVLYLYHMDKPQQWGEDFPLLTPGNEPIHFNPGQWTHLAQRVKNNSGNNADGEVQVWVNGSEALNLDGLRFDNDGSKIDTFSVSTFHGANSPPLGPLKDSFLWIDDI